MRTYALAAAALAVALTTGCKDRNRDDTGSRVDATADSASAEVREGANDVGDAVDTAADKVGDAARGVGDATEDAARQATGTWTWDRREEYRSEARARLDGLDRELAEARQPRRVGGLHQGRRGRPRDPARSRCRSRTPERGHRVQLERAERRFPRVDRLSRPAAPLAPAGRAADGGRRAALAVSSPERSSKAPGRLTPRRFDVVVPPRLQGYPPARPQSFRSLSASAIAPQENAATPRSSCTA